MTTEETIAKIKDTLRRNSSATDVLLFDDETSETIVLNRGSKNNTYTEEAIPIDLQHDINQNDSFKMVLSTPKNLPRKVRMFLLFRLFVSFLLLSPTKFHS